MKYNCSFERCECPRSIEDFNIIDGFNNITEMKINLITTIKIAINFSNFKKLKKLHINNCILSTGLVMNSLMELDNLEELIIENNFLNNKKRLFNFLENLKNKKNKLKILNFK